MEETKQNIQRFREVLCKMVKVSGQRLHTVTMYYKHHATPGMGYVFKSLSLLYKCAIFILIIHIWKKIYENKMIINRLTPDEFVNKPITTYKWFMEQKKIFSDLGEIDRRKYLVGTPICNTNISLESENKTAEASLLNVTVLLQNVKSGGFYAPQKCRSLHKVAILVPYRKREKNLNIFLKNIHPFLIKQLIEYRIFLIEQYGTKSFNKGALYNIGFLESQRFGDWNCYIFHDVDLLPLDDRILYSCPRRPTHMSSAVETIGYHQPYLEKFGGVTAMTTKQYEAVNGYSNLFSGWDAEHDMFIRLQSKQFHIVSYNKSIARYAAIPHEPNQINYWWYIFLRTIWWEKDEGLRTVEYKLIFTKKSQLYTHFKVDISPLQ